MSEERVSLKDHLFHTENVSRIAVEIQAVHPEFAAEMFVQDVIEKFPTLELMERMYWIRDCLREYLPREYEKAVQILLDSLPPPLDPAQSDNDFGEYIYGAYGSFVSQYGATAAYVHTSLSALKEMTTRFSCEFPIRVFINTFPKETLDALRVWSTDSHYHVRRLVSEGTRPKLPWAKKITLDYHQPIELLDILHADTTRFVTRSVANHLNDISKIDPDLVVKTLRRWKKENIQEAKELDYIVRHSLRSLIKQGYQPALELLGYTSSNVSAEINSLPESVKNGESILFSISISSKSDTPQAMLIDYIVHYQKANGSLAPKTFKLSKVTLQPHQVLTLTKSHSFKQMTTRKHYLGEHLIELQINGQKYGKQSFVLVH
jgi:3-methyladenine DNA glycosylase AlkC